MMLWFNQFVRNTKKVDFQETLAQNSAKEIAGQR